jgi:acyl-CoA synthetase (AMP-forming)/AMP-acid ligase II
MTAKTIKDGWLYTGDLAYMDEEGFIFFADRAKDLIIRGGENIFPAEIEDALRKHPKIMDVAVLGYPHPRLVEIVRPSSSPRKAKRSPMRRSSTSSRKRVSRSTNGPKR